MKKLICKILILIFISGQSFAEEIFMATKDDLKEFDQLISKENKKLPAAQEQKNRTNNFNKKPSDADKRLDKTNPRAQFQGQGDGMKRDRNSFNQRPPPASGAPGDSQMPPPPPNGAPPQPRPPPP